MNYKQGQDRKQTVLFAHTLDDIIDKQSDVRIIDTFVNSLDMIELGFVTKIQHTGCPAYNPSDLLKLYIYGYLNRTRSSRELEKETKRNVEVMWLINNLQPDHNTISNFRRDNSQGIKKVFEATVKIAKNRDLIGGKLIAGDSVKLRAQNSKKNNFNQEKLENQIAYLNKKIDEYNQLLDKEDANYKEVTTDKKALSTIEDTPLIQTVKQEYIKENPHQSKIKYTKEKLEKHEKQRAKYQELLSKLTQSQETQISTSDADSRNLPIKQQFTEVAYSVQATADAKNKIILDFEVTNKTDKAALSKSVERTANALESKDFVALYDKGYFCGAEIAKCHAMGVTVMVSPAVRPSASLIPAPAFHGDKFIYNKQDDTFLCPNKEILTSNGKEYTSPQGKFKQYKTDRCIPCPQRKNCTTSKRGIRIIERSQYAENVEINNALIKSNPQLYRLRQEIIEHPFGTIKRQWGFDHTIMKRGKDRVASDIGLIFTAYNLRRLINLLYKKSKNDKNDLNLISKIKKTIFKIFLCRLKLHKNSKNYFIEKKIACKPKRVKFEFLDRLSLCLIKN